METTDWIALGAGIVAMIALGVSVWSVFVSRRANTLSEDSNTVAMAALAHTERQTALAEGAERERERQAKARAVMEVEAAPLKFIAEGSDGNFGVVVTIKNTGDRDSGRTSVRVYMVLGSNLMAWEDEWTKHNRVRPLPDPAQTFYHPTTQGALGAQYIERIIDNITPTNPAQHKLFIPMAIPAPGAGVSRLPLRIILRADHADEPCVWNDYIQTEYGRLHPS